MRSVRGVFGWSLQSLTQICTNKHKVDLHTACSLIWKEYLIGREVHLHLSHPCHFHQRDLVFQQCLYIWFLFYLYLQKKNMSFILPLHSVIMLCVQTKLWLTSPWGFNNPLIEVDEFPFAVVDRGLAVNVADVCDLAWAFFTLYTKPKKKAIYCILRPARNISLCPVVYD